VQRLPWTVTASFRSGMPPHIIYGTQLYIFPILCGSPTLVYPMHHRSNVWRRYSSNMDSPFQSLSFCNLYRLFCNSSGYKMLHFINIFCGICFSVYLDGKFESNISQSQKKQSHSLQPSISMSESSSTMCASDFVSQHRLIVATSRVPSNCDWSKFWFVKHIQHSGSDPGLL